MAYEVLQTITIQYDTANDRFTYDPPYVPKINTEIALSKGNQPQICWRCEVDGVPPEEDNYFAIHFAGPCPLRHIRRRSIDGQIVEDIVVGGHDRPPARYHYFVAVLVLRGEDDAVTGAPFVPGIYTDDPDIMVW